MGTQTGFRWTGSDRSFLDALDIQLLAAEVASEIGHDQYDGYKSRNKALSDAIAGGLAVLTTVHKWRIYADFEEPAQVYRVWVER